jgi:hypothetical protein
MEDDYLKVSDDMKLCISNYSVSTYPSVLDQNHDVSEVRFNSAFSGPWPRSRLGLPWGPNRVGFCLSTVH